MSSNHNPYPPLPKAFTFTYLFLINLCQRGRILDPSLFLAFHRRKDFNGRLRFGVQPDRGRLDKRRIKFNTRYTRNAVHLISFSVTNGRIVNWKKYG